VKSTAIGSLLVRGLLSGALAGLVALVVASWLGEPSVGAAIAVEEAAHVNDGGEVELVSRTVQSTWGLLTALLGFGAAVGGLFGLAYAVARGRVGIADARASAAVLALAGFVTLHLVPFLKYPANPPGVGDPATIGRRSGLYFALVTLSVAAAVVATWFARRLTRLAVWDRALIGVGAYGVLVLAAMVVLPPVDEVGSDFPADVLWDFRTGSLATQLAVWASLGFIFGWLTHRSSRSAIRTRARS